MSVLIDTNVLLRRMQPNHPSHWAATESVAHFLANRTPVYFTSQNIAELWNVGTRPIVNNGLGLSISVIRTQVVAVEDLFTLLPDSPATYFEWKRLVSEHSVRGAKVHDARLVAAMNVHGVRRVLTFNTADFSRYEIEAIHPASVSS